MFYRIILLKSTKPRPKIGLNNQSSIHNFIGLLIIVSDEKNKGINYWTYITPLCKNVLLSTENADKNVLLNINNKR